MSSNTSPKPSDNIEDIIRNVDNLPDNAKYQLEEVIGNLSDIMTPKSSQKKPNNTHKLNRSK